MLCVFKQLRREEREEARGLGTEAMRGVRHRKTSQRGQVTPWRGLRALAPLPPRRLLKTLWSGPQPSPGEVGARGSYFLWCY